MRDAAVILLPAVIAAAALGASALLLPACGVSGAPWLNFCPADAAVEFRRQDELAARRAALMDEIATLQRRLAGLPACRPAAAAALPEPTPPTEIPVVAEPPVIAEPPVVAEAPPARPEGLRPPEAPPETPPDAPLDEQRWGERDLSLLEGCWNLDSDYTMVTPSGAQRGVRSWTMCFDAQGVGREVQTFTDGVRCEGPVVGKFAGDRLQIDEMDNVPCTDSMYITRRRSMCALRPDGRAACENFHPGVEGSTVDIILRR